MSWIQFFTFLQFFWVIQLLQWFLVEETIVVGPITQCLQTIIQSSFSFCQNFLKIAEGYKILFSFQTNNLSIYIYIYTHIEWNKINTFKLLLVSCFHIHQAYTITLTRYTHYIITTKFKLLSHFLTPVSIVLINIAVSQCDITLNIIIWRFSRWIYFDGNIWK